MSEYNKEVHELFRQNPLAWGYYFFPNHFGQESPPFHLKILKTIMNNKKVAICAPRGSSKSTIANFLYIIHSLCFNRFRHVIILQASLDKAMGSLDTIKAEIRDNELIKKTYRLKMPIDTQEETSFRSPNGFETLIKCFGREQMGKVRGSKFGAYRPDCIVGDDLEDDEQVRTRELREDLHRKFKDAIEPAIDIAADYRIIYIDTMKHYDSQLAKMINPDMYTDYKKMMFPAKFINKEGIWQSIWPARLPIELLNKLEKDDPITFAKEYMGDPVSGTSSSFEAKDFRRWTVSNDEYVLFDKDGGVLSKGSLRGCKAAIGYDLAWEESRRHDCTAIVPILMTPNSEYLVDYYTNERGVKPDALAEMVFSLDEKYMGITGKVVNHGFEKGKYEKVFKWYLDQERKKRNKFPIIKDVPWITDKKERIIVPLQPRYSNNVMFHRKDMGDLESQLLRFPSGTHDDIIDAEQLAVRMLTDAPEVALKRELTQNERFNNLRAMFTTERDKKGQFCLNKRHSIPAVKSFVVPSKV